MSREALKAEIEALLRRYRRDAVLLHRPYPPQEAPRTNSKFGGLPRLPERYEWPRTVHGVPLHFLVQVDCADIPLRSQLPERGVLFFFARDDAEQAWEGPAGDVRVVYALDAFAATPLREAPADLEPIGGMYPRPAWRDLLLDGESAPALHIEWPIRPLRVDSWPDFGALPEASDHAGASLSGLLSDPDHGHGGFRAVFDRAHRRREDFLERLDAYEEILAEWSTAAVAAATGRTLDRPVGGSERDLEVAAALMFAPQAGSAGPWPDRWIDAHYFARTVLKQADYLVGAERSAGLRDAAADWLARSLDRPLTAEMEAGERRRFRDWVTSIRWPEDVRPIGGSVARPVIAAAAAAIRAWAGDRALAALIPPEVYAAMKTEFDGSAYWGPCYSHMLGHGPSAQEPLPVDDPTLCLLNLASEPALGWMFGDVGNATFWISPQDLARRDFSKVRAAVQGN